MQQVPNPPYRPRQPENGHAGHGAGSQGESEDPWNVRIGLAFDGGGVRGYFSLLVLEDLMREIQKQERLDGNIQHSFAPCVCPPIFSNEALPFLPCHYFDYIGGTSTGALISILLSRFRMTSSECLGEYETMAGRIFRNPRRYYAGTRISLLTRVRKRKYPTRDMRQAIRDVISRRQERAPGHQNADETPARTEPDDVLFQTKPGTCRGLAVSAQIGPLAETLFLIRSYGSDDPNHPSPASIENMVKGGTLPVCFAARAATAAPTFFRNLVLDVSRPALPSDRVSYRLADHRGDRAPPGWDRQTFTDAGWVRANNPCLLVLGELEAGGTRPRIVLVSVGTADRPDRTGRGFAEELKAMVRQATDAEEVHQRMVERAGGGGAASRISYFRFNLPRGLPVGTDEWQPRGRGQTTRQTIRAAFETWRNQEEAQRDRIECARRLVQLRRQRVSADPARWDRYALG